MIALYWGLLGTNASTCFFNWCWACSNSISANVSIFSCNCFLLNSASVLIRDRLLCNSVVCCCISKRRFITGSVSAGSVLICSIFCWILLYISSRFLLRLASVNSELWNFLGWQYLILFWFVIGPWLWLRRMNHHIDNPCTPVEGYLSLV